MLSTRCRNSARRIRFLATAATAWCLGATLGAGAQEAKEPPEGQPFYIEVAYTLRDAEKTISAKRLGFDGQAFNLTTPNGAVFHIPVGDVRLFDIDLAGINDQLASLRKMAEKSKAPTGDPEVVRLAEENANMRVQLGKIGKDLDTALEKLSDADLRAAEMKEKIADLQEERNLALAAQDRTTSETAAQGATLSAKNAEIAGLKKQTDVLKREIGDLKAQLDLADNPTRALRIAQDESKRAASKVPGVTLVEGTVTNTASRDYGAVVLEISAYDKEKLLGVGSTFLPDVRAREKARIFKADVECDPTQVTRVEIAPVLLGR